MGYQKIINVLGNTLNQPTKSRQKKLVEINDELGGSITQMVKLDLKFQC